VKHVSEILEALARVGLQLKPEKCEFHVTKVDFLGFVVTSEGIRVSESKIQAVLSWEQPKNITQMQQFLGFANFCRRFIKDYSKITAPLTDLTKKDKPYIWTEKAQKAFELLKEQFTSEPILIIFNPEKPITIETNASDFAIGAVASQPDSQNRLKPFAYHSKKLTGAELNWEIYNKELFAIVDAFRTWRIYVIRPKYPVKIFSDHKNLTY